MISDEHHNALDQKSYEQRLQQLEHEIRHQRDTIELIDSRLGTQDRSLGSLKAYVALMVATWHSEIGFQLNEISRQIDCTGADDEAWSILRRHVEGAHGEFSRHIEGSTPALTELETRICLLLGMELTTQEIATTMNISLATTATICQSIRRKIEQTGAPDAREMVPVA